jgi:[CysO sulfur-carrier protein]-S-L-cysteine hydrolase
MKLLLPSKIVARWRAELRRAGSREIGGVLLGEHVEEGEFRILELTVQREGGTETSFVRDPAQHRRAIDDFFDRTGRQYERLNYVGEWHSHPRFQIRPSQQDIQEMGALLGDSNVGAAFAILVIVRLRMWIFLEASAYAFRLGHPPEEIDIISETRRRFI